MKNWLVATYKINKLKILEENLKNQKFKYYIPKIRTIKLNSLPKDEPLFPGYIFIFCTSDKYLKLKYTIGIKDVISYDHYVPVLNDDEICKLKELEQLSYIHPILEKIFIGQEISLIKGPLRNSIATIASMPKDRRIKIFINLLGNRRSLLVPLNTISIS